MALAQHAKRGWENLDPHTLIQRPFTNQLTLRRYTASTWTKLWTGMLGCGWGSRPAVMSSHQLDLHQPSASLVCTVRG